MKLEKVLIRQEPLGSLTYLETERYIFTEFDLKMLLIDAFTSGSFRALNMDNDDLAVKNYINNLFKD